MAEATYLSELETLNEHRKLLNKAFIEKDTGCKFQLVAFTLEYGTRTLLAILCLCSHSAYKVAIPFRALNVQFEMDNPNNGDKNVA